MARRGSDPMPVGRGWLLLVLAAVAAGVIPLPADVVERYYSRALYPLLQLAVTSTSNLVPVALLDVAAALLLLIVLARVLSRRRRPYSLAAGAMAIATFAAALYLVFLVMWGLNYRREPLERKLAFDRMRITNERALAFGRGAVEAINSGYDAAHAREADFARLAEAFRDAQRALAPGRTAVAGRPKRSVLGLYFRWAAIDGMTDPFFLEVIVNPDVLPVERPFVLAHEWAHLAGYANETEASFVAWLTCLRADDAARYSGWLAIYSHLVVTLPREARREVVTSLGDGPRRDLSDIADRVNRAAPIVRRAASNVYDSYLRANRVPGGIASYDRVVQLILGSEFSDGWTPVQRSEPSTR